MAASALGVAAPLAQPVEWRILQPQAASAMATGLFAVASTAVLIAGVSSGSLSETASMIIAMFGCQLLLRLFLEVRTIPRAEKSWLLAVCRCAFFARVIVAVVIYLGPWDRYLFGEDQIGYDWVPQTIAKYWLGDSFRPVYLSDPTVLNRIGYFGFVAAQYYLLGYVLLVPRITNCLGGALVVFFAYRIADKVFGRAAAQVTAVATAFFPSLILWSALNMRDIWLALAILVIIWHALLIREQFRPTSVAVILACLFWMQHTRSYLVLIMGAAIVSIFFLARSGSFFRDVVVATTLGVLLLGAHWFLGFGQEGLELLDLEKIAAQREKLAAVTTGGSGYLGTVAFTGPASVILFLPLGVAYFLLSPFPWQMTAGRRLVLLPEMLVWYACLPLLIAEMRLSFKAGSGKALALALPILMISATYALGTANVGLAYRYRAQIVALLLIFVSAGYVRTRRRARHSIG